MNFYGQYRFPIISKATRGKPHEFRADAFPSFVRENMAEHFASRGVLASTHDADNVIATALAEWKVLNGEGIHLFIHRDTVGVIDNATRRLDDWEILRYTIGCSVGVLYSPDLPPTMFFQPDDGSMGVATNDFGIFRVERDHEEGWAMTNDIGHKTLANQLRLVCGAFMMKEEFPEMFIAGPPEGIKHPAWYRKLNSVHASLSRVRGDMAPHIRRGHFRLLQSERYTKKRGQLVFVKASMVKGEAKHTEGDKND